MASIPVTANKLIYLHKVFAEKFQEIDALFRLNTAKVTRKLSGDYRIYFPKLGKNRTKRVAPRQNILPRRTSMPRSNVPHVAHVTINDHRENYDDSSIYDGGGLIYSRLV